jgi:hypothetical protein
LISQIIYITRFRAYSVSASHLTINFTPMCLRYNKTVIVRLKGIAGPLKAKDIPGFLESTGGLNAKKHVQKERDCISK